MGTGWENYNQSEAFSSLNNMNNANISINLSNYPALQNMTNSSALDNPDTAVQTIFTPITSVWASSSLWGSWFYVLLIFFTVGTVYIKSQSLHRTCIVMLFMSLLAVVPGSSGALYIPSTALHLLYVLTGVGLAGVLYSFWVGD
jgi:hypothetical protein